MEARLWQATNPEARDFRVRTFGRKFASTVIEPDAPGLYTADVPAPEAGWTAWFVELTYDVNAAMPLKLTTEVAVTPDTLPFSEEPFDLPTSVTTVCTAPSASRAQDIGAEAEALAASKGLAADGIATSILGARLYLNWTPTASFAEGAVLVGGFLKERDCADIGYQLESGPGATLPPAAQPTQVRK